MEPSAMTPCCPAKRSNAGFGGVRRLRLSPAKRRGEQGGGGTGLPSNATAKPAQLRSQEHRRGDESTQRATQTRISRARTGRPSTTHPIGNPSKAAAGKGCKNNPGRIRGARKPEANGSRRPEMARYGRTHPGSSVKSLLGQPSSRDLARCDLDHTKRGGPSAKV